MQFRIDLCNFYCNCVVCFYIMIIMSPLLSVFSLYVVMMTNKPRYKIKLVQLNVDLCVTMLH